jgi:hypothetical protein
MGARNEEKASVAIEEIEVKLRKDANGNSKGSVHWLKLDLSNPRLVKEAGTWFLSKEERLDILGTTGLYKYRVIF